MTKTYGYIRVSTETQAEKGFGLEDQQRGIEEYAAQNGLTIERIFVDAGISGAMSDTDEDDALSKRAGLMDLFTAIEDKDTVIIMNTSRLWRSDMAKVLIRRVLKKKHINLISIQQPRYNMYEENPNEKILSVITEALDEWEKATIALKLSRGRTTKAKGGDKPAGVCPFGYRYAADKKSVEIDPDEAAIVKQMFTEGQKGQSLHKIADTMNAQGYKTRRGKEWGAGNVQAILRNNFYVGTLTHQGIETKGNHPPIISKVQFGKVAAQLTKRKRG